MSETLPCNLCCRNNSAAALQLQASKLTLKYANFEAKFRYQNEIGTPMIVGQNLDILHIFKEEWAVQNVASTHIAAHPENARFMHVLRKIIDVTG